MHPARRRKKRPSYGVRTVEVQRGGSGFGFTISGQAPCLLSCIVAASPADAAGLRPGDYLLAVNGQNVASSLHDEVVQLIGGTQGTLRLQIAENYYTDSSEDEACLAARNKHKPAHRPRHRHAGQRAVAGRASPGFSWDDDEPPRRAPVPPPPPRDPQGFLQPTAPAPSYRPAGGGARRPSRPGAGVAAAGLGERLVITEQEVNGLIYPTLQELQRERQQEAAAADAALFRAVVGYLGTIEMPKEKDLAGSRLQAIRNCIRRLRVEKKVHTLVLMSVLPGRVMLSNTHGWALAAYPADRITFCGIYADDKRFFGLVTVHRHEDVSDQSQGDDSSPPPISSSCHVFMVDPKLADHALHARRARAFGLQCSPALAAAGGGDIALCQEFPDTAEPILQAILGLYRNRVLPGMADPDMQPASPPHSNTSSNSSNSDSGIGFRDDGHTAERIFVVDVERERLRIHRVGNQAGGGGVMGPPPPPPPPPAAEARRRGRPLQHSNSCKSSECSFVRSLEDLRGAGAEAGDAASAGGSGRLAAARLLHGSDTELTRLVTGTEARRFVRSLERHPDEVRTDPGGDGNDEEEERTAELEPEAKQRWTKGQSFRRRLNRRALSPPPAARSAAVAQHSQQEEPTPAKACASGSEAAADSSAAERTAAPTAATAQEEGGRAAAWALSFERLLEDPAGLHTFAEFLKSQFSHENIYFWVACERYKLLAESADLRRQVAQQVYERHLCVGAPEPVNVDSQAQQAAQDGVELAAVGLFDKAQQQIFSLMKYDCYPRFLKSTLYTDCVARETAGQPLPYLGGEALDPDLRVQAEDAHQKPAGKGGKSSGKEAGGEQRRRKSLLPWHRKDRSKSKDRGEAEYKRKKRQREREESGSIRSDLSGSRTSLASADLAAIQRGAASKESLVSEGGGASSAPADAECLLCRVVLPDASSAVVQAAPDVSVRVMLQRLLDRRGLPYNSWDVYLAGSDRPLDQSLDSCCLGCKEVRMEQRVLFRVDLPNQKTIGVKAKPNRQAADVLRPILGKYGFKLDSVLVYECGGSGAPLDLKAPVTRLDNRNLVVRWREQASEPAPPRGRPFPSLDEITNRVFEDLLQGKSDGSCDDFGVVDLDQHSVKTDGSSDRSSGLAGSLPGRDGRRGHRAPPAGDRAGELAPPPPPPPPRLTDSKETDVALYEGLKRAQMCRLEDQRGTEINFELPEFLKRREAVQNKENQQPERLSEPVHLRRRAAPPGAAAAEQRRTMLPVGRDQRHSLAADAGAVAALPAGWRGSRALSGGFLPTEQQAEEYFQSEFEWNGRLSLGLGDNGQLACPPMPRLTPRRPELERTAAGETATTPLPTPPQPLTTSLHLDEADFSPPTPLSEASLRPPLATGTPPPPLPPKPKLLWRGPPPRPPGRPSASEELAAGRSRKAIYLDQAEKLNISFV